jgi:hypothetical protein
MTKQYWSFEQKIVLHWAWVVLLIGALLLAGCAGDRADGGDVAWAARPQATSTPATDPVTPVVKGKQAMIVEAVVTPVPADLLSELPTEEQLHLVAVPTRDLRDLAERLKPGVDEIPLVVNATRPDYEIGDRLPFWVHDTQRNSNSQITAELVHMTDVAYAWVEVDQPYSRDDLARSIDRFSEEVYPAQVEFFGREANPGIDNDPRLHILHTTRTGSGVAGYYSSADQYSNLANPFSNEKEMFYINLSWLNGLRNYEAYETVLAHEFQHMIHWANDRNEETWINEGLSEFAQEVVGYPPDTVFARTFANRPDTQLNTWNESTGDNAEHYGSSYLFTHYFAQRFGPDVTRLLVAQPANGTEGVSEALAEAGLDETFETLFADWVVANYVDDPNALGMDGVYGYRDFMQAPPRLDKTFDRVPISKQQSTVNNYATDYILLETAGDITIDFAGQASTQLARTRPFSGDHAWWSHRGDDSNTRLTREFDLTDIAPGEPVEMEVAMWWNIEVDYDYGYVLASRDGQQWDILPGQSTTTENPSGNSFGAAYTGRSVDPHDENGDTAAPEWRQERFDLSAYAGEEILLRFEYVTDDAVNSSGWLIDDIRIPAIGYSTDFEDGVDGWQSEGWLLTDNRLEQRWLLQVLELQDNILMDLQRVEVDEDGRAAIAIDDLGEGRTAVLAISAMAPVTTEPAAYEFNIEQAK